MTLKNGWSFPKIVGSWTHFLRVVDPFFEGPYFLRVMDPFFEGHGPIFGGSWTHFLRVHIF